MKDSISDLNYIWRTDGQLLAIEAFLLKETTD